MKLASGHPSRRVRRLHLKDRQPADRRGRTIPSAAMLAGAGGVCFPTGQFHHHADQRRCRRVAYKRSTLARLVLTAGSTPVVMLTPALSGDCRRTLDWRISVRWRLDYRRFACTLFRGSRKRGVAIGGRFFCPSRSMRRILFARLVNGSGKPHGLRTTNRPPAFE